MDFEGLVPRVGLEPTRGYPHQILSLARLPVSPPRQGVFTCMTTYTVPWSRRLPTLPPGYPGSTLGAKGLSVRVRDGSARVPPAVGADSQGRCNTSPSECIRTPWDSFHSRSGRILQGSRGIFRVKPPGRLVPVGYARCRAFTSGLSSRSSSCGLRGVPKHSGRRSWAGIPA